MIVPIPGVIHKRASPEKPMPAFACVSFLLLCFLFFGRLNGITDLLFLLAAILFAEEKKNYSQVERVLPKGHNSPCIIHEHPWINFQQSSRRTGQRKRSTLYRKTCSVWAKSSMGIALSDIDLLWELLKSSLCWIAFMYLQLLEGGWWGWGAARELWGEGRG